LNPRESLRFGWGNAKLDRSGLLICTFSLPSGKTCPGARDCRAHVVRNTVDGRHVHKVVDGRHQKYRCFSATDELRPAVYSARHHNLAVLRKHGAGRADTMAAIIDKDMPADARYVRVHVGGDFFDQAYFDAWLAVAGCRPKVKFYAYTKSLDSWVARLGAIPPNLVLTASRGGDFDHLIDIHGLKEARVVFHPEEAAALGLEEDHDESHAMDPACPCFALRLHGMQPKGSHAAAATVRMRKEEISFSYSRKK
jgi:hypothetical protein